MPPWIMAAETSLTFQFNHPDETAEFAQRLASRLDPGDVILLEGDVGAGKTHFARSLIQSLLDVPEDVPSPTFTLVQTYEAKGAEIWHADLYRLSSAQEVEELGLGEAFQSAICLVEWPDRLGAMTPLDALTLNFQTGYEENERIIAARWTSPRWDTLLHGIAT